MVPTRKHGIVKRKSKWQTTDQKLERGGRGLAEVCTALGVEGGGVESVEDARDKVGGAEGELDPVDEAVDCADGGVVCAPASAICAARDDEPACAGVGAAGDE
jgi:hypothetical protein